MQNTQEKLLDYMQKKYEDDTFTYVSSNGSGWGDSETSIVLKSEKYPQAKVIVSQRTNEQGEKIIEDNYMSFVFENEITAELKDAFEQVYGQCDVVYKPPQSSLITGGMETDIKEYMENPDSGIAAVVFINSVGQEKGRDMRLEYLREILEGKGISMSASVVFTQDSEALSANIDNYIEFLNKTEIIDMRCNFLLDEEFQFVYANWR